MYHSINCIQQTLQTTPDQYPRGVYLRIEKNFSPSWRRRPYVYISPQATECGFAMLITHRMCRLSITHDETATTAELPDWYSTESSVGRSHNRWIKSTQGIKVSPIHVPSADALDLRSKCDTIDLASTDLNESSSGINLAPLPAWISPA